MNSRSFVVRIVTPSSKPALPKRAAKKSINKSFLTKPLNILLGSGMGFAAGLLIYVMLKASGLNMGNLESSLIIGFPSVIGIATSFVIF